jgi:DNA polymerase-3 subunit delta'
LEVRAVAFDSVLGHERVRALLARQLADGRLPPAVLMTGPSGVGKRTLALAVARALVCGRPDGGCCDACPSCRRVLRAISALPEARAAANADREPTRFNHLLHPDVLLLEPSPDEIRVAQVRAVVRSLASSPFEGRGRAVVVDQAHLLRAEAGNALLKALEEPPPRSHFLLVSAAPGGLLPTIRSRCQTIRMHGLAPATIEGFLVEREALSVEEARFRARMASGSLGDALALDSSGFKDTRARVLETLEGLIDAGTAERLTIADRLRSLEDLPLALTVLRSVLRDLAALRSGADARRLLNADVAPAISSLAATPLGRRAWSLAVEAGHTRRALKHERANELLAIDRLVDVLADAER